VTEKELRKVVPGDLLWKGDVPLLVLEIGTTGSFDRGGPGDDIPLVEVMLPSGKVSWTYCDGVSPFSPPGV